MQRFPNIEKAVVILVQTSFEQLATSSGIHKVGTEYPSEVIDRLPFVRVRALATQSGYITTYRQVDIDVLARRYDEAYDLAGDIEQVVMAAPHRVQLPDRVVVLEWRSTPQGPQEVPWIDPSIHRIVASYVLGARR